MSGKRALITGISGQDGSYLAELLIEKGYEVHGIVLPAELEDPQNGLYRLEGVRSRLKLHAAALKSYAAISEVFAEARPRECYHLAAQSFVGYSLNDEFSTLETNMAGTHFVLAALKELAPECRFFFASSSEMFGRTEEVPQNEHTRFRPRSIYGISKVAGFELTRHYRENHGLHAGSGILFNHESPRRGFEFVTRKITSGIARILAGRQEKLALGNLEARRDWGHAREYVEAMWLMLQQPAPDDYVVATGETHTVGEFVELACSYAGLDPEKHVEIDPRLYRPAEGNILRGDAAKAKRRLGWSPRTGFAELVREMVVHDCMALGVTGAFAQGGPAGAGDR
jgi:GDPmannose 4,6-dehydratase